MRSIDKHFQQATPSANTSSSQFMDPGQDLRRIAVKTLQEKTTESLVNQDGQLSRETRQVIQELQEHQIELELKNQQLRQNQMELDAARRRYFDLYDMAPVGYCNINENGLIMESNLTAADLLGVTREELIMQPISRYILHEDQDQYYLFRNHFMEVLHRRSAQNRLTRNRQASSRDAICGCSMETEQPFSGHIYRERLHRTLMVPDNSKKE